jgi:hypothetical protein
MKMFDNWRRRKEAPVAGDAAETPAPVAEVDPPVDESASLSLELGDFLHRIPVGLLKDDAPDPKRVVRVDISELAQCITSGRSTTTLERLFRKTPGLFRPDAPPLDGVEIFYPWQKILRLVAQPALGDGPGLSVQHLLAEMKRCTAAKAAPAPAADKTVRRGAVHRMRHGGGAVSWMSVQRPSAAAPGPEITAGASIAVEPEAAREIPIRVAAPPATPTVLRMPDLSLEAEAPVQKGGASRVGTMSTAPAAPAPQPSAIPDLAPALELKLALIPDLAPLDETPAPSIPENAPASPTAMAIPDLALSDESAPLAEQPSGNLEVDSEDIATIHFPPFASAMPDLAMTPDEPEMPEAAAELPLPTDAEMAELRRNYEVRLAALEAAQRSAADLAEQKASALADAEHQRARMKAEHDQALAALREQHAETEKRHEHERAELERKVADFIQMGDSAVRERDVQIAAQREEMLAEAKAREETLNHERLRAEAAADAARAESIALLEQARSAAALETDRLRAELETAKDELLAATATRDAEKAIAEAEVAERESQLQWKERTIEGLEGDVESYRNRIKAVLKQRDEFAEEKKLLTLQLRELEQRLSRLAAPAELQA